MSNIKIGELSQQSQEQRESLLGKVIERLKITCTWKGKEVCKGFDPFTISWRDEGKALEEFCLFIKKELYPLLGPLFKVGPLALYTEDVILDVIMYMAVNGVTSENGANAFKKEYKKESPSPRTIRYRLGKLEFLEVESAFLEANKKILSYFKQKQKKNNKILSVFKQETFEAPVLLSLDITHTPCYGKRRKHACGMKRDKGTNYGYKYGSVVVSAPGIRVTLHTVPMTELDKNEEMVEKLITEAKEHVDIKAVLEDREFFNEPAINNLESLADYLMPVKKHRKKLLQSLRPPCKAEIPLGSRKVPVIAVKSPKDPKKTLYYCTTMDIPDKELEKVIELYKNRWTVENAFKSKKMIFLAKTYSVNFAIRFFFWALATLLYNAWVLCNFCAYTDLKVKPSKQKRPKITAFQFGISMKITFLSPLFLDDGPEELLLLAIAFVKQYVLKNLPSERVIPQYMMSN